MTLRRILALVQELRPRVDIPLLLMGYANPLYAMGEEQFATAAREVGVDGLLVPDLPPEEGAGLYDACRKQGLDTILLAAPTTTPERMALLTRETRGFLYYVSLTGVTSARTELAEGIEDGVRRAKALSSIPVVVGFGVSTPAHAATICAYADGVAVGSAIVDRIEQAADRSEAIDSVSRFVADLKAPLRG